MGRIPDFVTHLPRPLEPNETITECGLRIGYRRVSTIDQNLDRQDLGAVDKVFEEKLSGATAKDRPALQQLIEFAREGDEVVVWSIDRMARDLRDLQTIIQTLTDKDVSVSFLSERLTFSSISNDPFATLQLNLLGSVAQFERSIIRKRQAEGIQRAKARGAYKGRKATIDPVKIKELRTQGMGASSIAAALKISRVSVYRALKAA